MTAYVPLNLDAIFGPTPGGPLTPAGLPPEWLDRYEERAGIRQYDGGMGRAAAESAAFADVLDLMNSTTKRG